MKRLLMFSLMIGVVVVFFAACSDDDEDESDFIIEYNSLPTKAKNFVSDHFPKNAPSMTKEMAVAQPDGTYYTTYLTGGYTIDFDKGGNWLEVDGDTKPVPGSLFDSEVPKEIETYVTENFPAISIVEIKKTTYLSEMAYKIELSDDTDLLFDKDGNFVK